MEMEEESVCFNNELGLSTTLWAQVEEAIIQVLQSVLHKSDHRKVAIGFLSIENFRSKLAFVDAVMQETKPAQKHLAEWSRILIRLTNASTKRNKLAHHRAHLYVNEIPGRRVALLPWTIIKEPVKSKLPNGALCVRDIVTIKLEFFALFVVLNNFADRLSGREPQIGAHHEQPKSAPTLREIRNQTRAALIPQPQPSAE